MSQDYSRLVRPIRRSALLLVPLLLALPLYAGCKGFENPFGGGTTEDDPFLPGGRIPTQGNTPPPERSQAGATTDTTRTNPTPPTNWNPSATGTTPGALTGTGGGQPVDTRPDPRSSGPGLAGWQTTTTNGTGAALRTIEGTGDPGRLTPTPGGPGVVAAGGFQRVETLEQAFATLKSYGMTWGKASQLGETEEWSFECSIRNSQTPGINLAYIGRGNGQLGAMKNVIDEIAKERAGK